MLESRRCPECARSLPDDAPQGLCPGCLLTRGLESTAGGSVLSTRRTETSDSSESVRRPLLPGSRFGPYLILGLLGKGGMGEVYEAEHQENGQRLALKLLGRALGSQADRERFLREGRLAAKINHPNSLYVYGTEEVQDTPVISMELLPGGTLRDRVQQDGPLSPADAVDAILEVIAGLAAAAGAGVLHRDVKPSNCFIDADGTVKVGDYGLSIFTLASGESGGSASGYFIGTPAFAAPEQLRGGEPDLRSDIYSVGATLYYLLTGKAPYEAENGVELLASIMEGNPVRPHELCPGIPKGLSRIVLRCLAKRAEMRFNSYSELVKALEPFGSTWNTAVDYEERVRAFVVDGFLWMVIISYYAGYGSDHGWSLHWLVLPSFAGIFLYFTLLEGIWGTCLGKEFWSLRVLRADGDPPGLGRAALRALVFLLGPFLLYLATGVATESAVKVSIVLLLSPMALLTFVSARPWNGYACLHDLVSGTRVFDRRTPQPSSQESFPPEDLFAESARPQIGPYFIVKILRDEAHHKLLSGFDPKLQRWVWIHMLPPGLPPLPAHKRNLARPGRPRWLNGCRKGNECWDAYAATAGKSLAECLQSRQRWTVVRQWLWDLADEIEHGLEDESLPDPLRLDNIWITASGRARILDFRSPGTERVPAFPRGFAQHVQPSDWKSVQSFLAQIALRGLEGSAYRQGEVTRRQLRGHRLFRDEFAFLKKLSNGTFGNPGSLNLALESLYQKEKIDMRMWLIILVGFPLYNIWLQADLFFNPSATRHSHPIFYMLIWMLFLIFLGREWVLIRRR